MFFTIPVKIEDASLNLPLTIPTGAPITIGNDGIEMLPAVTDKNLITYQNSQKKQCIY